MFFYNVVSVNDIPEHTRRGRSVNVSIICHMFYNTFRDCSYGRIIDVDFE